jgi:hypothetical protein
MLTGRLLLPDSDLAVDDKTLPRKLVTSPLRDGMPDNIDLACRAEEFLQEQYQFVFADLEKYFI